MLSHQKHVAKIGRCSYNAGLIVSPSGIGHVDMGHAEESEEHGNVSEDLNARYFYIPPRQTANSRTS